jgi:hypothetical protein
LWEGLAEEILLEAEGMCFSQPIDYVGFPFKCARCHSYKYITCECSLKLTRKMWVRKDPVQSPPIQSSEVKFKNDEKRVDPKFQGSDKQAHGKQIMEHLGSLEQPREIIDVDYSIVPQNLLLEL